MKTFKGLLWVMVSMVLLYATCFAEAKEKPEKFDFMAEYTGEIITSDSNFILVMMSEPEMYSVIRIRDKQGFIVDGDVIRGQLFRMPRTLLFTNVTQDSKFTGIVESAAHSWKEIERQWQYRYEL